MEVFRRNAQPHGTPCVKGGAWGGRSPTSMSQSGDTLPCLPQLNKPADAGVLLQVNSPVNCKGAADTVSITEEVEETWIGRNI